MKLQLSRTLALLAMMAIAAPAAKAQTYYWDNNGDTPGFGTAGGTWAASTAANWSTSAQGDVMINSVTTLITDALHFGTADAGLAAGTITVSGTVDAGSLTFGSASGAIVLSGGTINLGANSIITVNNATNTISSILSGAGTSFTKNGTGILILSGNNSYTGQTVISAGTLQIGAGGATGTLGSGTVLNDATLIINRNDAFLVSNIISGSGSVRTNAGSMGQLIDIAANNSYSGGTFIDVGILRLRTDLGGGADLGTGTVTVASGASYEIWAPTAKTLANNIVLNGATGVDNRAALNQDGGPGLVTLTGTVTLNATSDIGVGGLSSNNMTITGVVSGAAGAGLIVDERNGSNFNVTLTLSGANTYTGPTTVTGGTLKAGVVSVANVSGAFGNNSAITLSNIAGVTLDIAGFATQIGSLTGGGTTGGNVILGTAGNARTLTVGGDNTSPAAYAGVISQAGGLTKIGTGTQILSGTNTYTGTTAVNEGTLTFAGSSSGTLGTIFVGGAGTATLNIQAGNYTQGAGGFFVGANGTGIVNQTGGAVSWNNNGLQLLIGNGGFAGTYNLSGGSVTTLTGVTTRGVMLGVNDNSSATFNLSGTGSLTVAGTTRLMIGRSDATQINTTNLFSQSGGTATISVLTMGGTSGGAGSGNSATLTLTGGTFTATAFSLLSAANNDVSTINIGGTAVVTLPNLPTARGTSATATLNFDGGTLRNSATGTFITGLTNAFIEDGGAQFNTSLNSTTISQALRTHGSSLGGGLTKLGTNTLTLSGANTYTGATIVNAGTLQAGVASVANVSGAFGNNSAVTLANVSGAILNITGFNTRIGSLTGGGATGGNVTLGAATLTVGGNNTSPAAYAGVISGTSGALTKIGTGTLTLSGTNTYTGPTAVDAGTLLVNGTHTGGAAYSVAGSATLGGSGSIPAAVTVAAAGTLAGGDPLSSTANALTLTNGFSTVTDSRIGVRILTDSPILNDLNPASNSFLSITAGATIDSGVDFVLSGTPSPALTLPNYTYRIAAGAGDQSTLSISDQAQFDASALTGGAAYQYSITGNVGGEVFLNLSPVPEPVSILAIAAVGCGVLLRRRRASTAV